MQRAEFRQNGFNSEIVFEVIFNLNFILLIKLNMQFYYSEVIYRYFIFYIIFTRVDLGLIEVTAVKKGWVSD